MAAFEHLDPLGAELRETGTGGAGLAHPDGRALREQDPRRRRAGHAGADHDRALALERTHHSSPSPPRLTKSV